MNNTKYIEIHRGRVARMLNACWPEFGVSLSRPSQYGWLANVFFEMDVPHIWRSNTRIPESRFWHVFAIAASKASVNGRIIVFHDGHAGWRGDGRGEVSRFLALDGVDVAVDFMKKRAYYSRSQWEYGRKSDNYYLFFPDEKMLAAFTHHGEFYCFSRNKDMLLAMGKTFFRNRLSVKYSF